VDSIIDEINFKLEKLGQFIDILKEYQSYEIEEIRDNRTLRGAVERYIEISLACMIDICEMIISTERFTRPDSYREAILTLGQHDILPKDFAEYIARYLIAKHGNRFI
jgi:uncharacterized protein YutE (UPF0331/DUF86 family)